MTEDIEPTPSRKLRDIPASQLVTGGPIFIRDLRDGVTTSPVAVLDIAGAQRELADAGIRVPDINRLANMLATRFELNFGGRPASTQGDRFAQLIFGALFAGVVVVLGSQVQGYVQGEWPQEVVDAVGWITWGASVLGILVVMGLGLRFFVGNLTDAAPRLPARRRRALEIISNRVTLVELPAKSKNLILRAERAERAIKDSEVWSTNFFDSHRVRIDLTQEVDEIIDRLRQLVSITGGSARMGRQADHVVKSTTERVEALETYRDQVLVCERDLKRLAAAETEEYNADRLTDLLAGTGADQSQIDNLSALSNEARAASEAIRETLQIMSGTIAELATPDNS
ncbi:MAG: hypothetical protein ACRDTJ_25180 [Pseudonocardiaceae bacterium]